MQRITKRVGRKVYIDEPFMGKQCPTPMFFCENAKSCRRNKARTCPVLRLLDRCAEYEDTGRTPEEVVKMCGEVKTAYDENGIPYAVEYTGLEAKHVTDLIAAEQDGHLKVLPCKVGDTVFAVISYCGKPLGIVKDVVQMVGITSKGVHVKLRNHHEYNKTYIFGKTAFLTHEEAEAAMKKER